MVQTGLERFLSDIERFRNRNIALIANHTSVTSKLRYSWDIFKENGIGIKKVFSPEHGLFGTEQDQMPVLSQSELKFDIISLYGDSYESLLPDISYLDDIDLVIFDIQDIGARYYTYLNSMFLFLKAIESIDLEFFVLDRPNPLGGSTVEGPILKDGYESFVGILPVTVRHGLTAGELAILAVDYYGLSINLNVIEMRGWEREMRYSDTGLPWIPPSPNMPSLKTADLYPGICLLEGTNISEGRGTTTPFEVIGAPFINPYPFAEILNSLDLEGVFFRPVFFKPTFNKYFDETVGGVYMHITNNKIFKPFQTGVALTESIYKLYSDFEFIEGVYEFNTAHPAYDLLSGCSAIREMIISNRPLQEIINSWKSDEDAFVEYKEKYHLY